MSGRCVAHLDMDAFYVSVELRRRPELRGLPVVVAGTGPRAVVTTASYEARKFGVGSAIPASRARRLCPQAVFLAPDFTYYRDASRQVMEIVRAHVETVEVIGLDEAYLELTGLPEPVATMRRMVAEIASATDLNASVGSRPEQARRQGGIGRREATRLRRALPRAGVRPVRGVAVRPGAGYRAEDRRAARRHGHRHAGKARERLERRAHGAVRSALRTRASAAGAVRGRVARSAQQRKVVSESRETTFDFDISDPARLEEILCGLVEQLCRGLATQHRCGRTIGIKVRLDDFSTHTRARTLSEPIGTADRIGPVAIDLLRRFDAPRPVRLLGVRVAGLERAAQARRGPADARASEPACASVSTARWRGAAERPERAGSRPRARRGCRPRAGECPPWRRRRWPTTR